MMQQDLEGLAIERARAWNVEIEHQKLVSQIPRQPAWWQRSLGIGLMHVGCWLTRAGKWLARSPGAGLDHGQQLTDLCNAHDYRTEAIGT